LEEETSKQAKAINEQEKAEGRRPNKQLLIFTQNRYQVTVADSLEAVK
jgi:hypothetical protein